MNIKLSCRFRPKHYLWVVLVFLLLHQLHLLLLLLPHWWAGLLLHLVLHDLAPHQDLLLHLLHRACHPWGHLQLLGCKEQSYSSKNEEWSHLQGQYVQRVSYSSNTYCHSVRHLLISVFVYLAGVLTKNSKSENVTLDTLISCVNVLINEKKSITATNLPLWKVSMLSTI